MARAWLRDVEEDADAQVLAEGGRQALISASETLQSIADVLEKRIVATMVEEGLDSSSVGSAIFGTSAQREAKAVVRHLRNVVSYLDSSSRGLGGFKRAWDLWVGKIHAARNAKRKVRGSLRV